MQKTNNGDLLIQIYHFSVPAGTANALTANYVSQTLTEPSRTKAQPARENSIMCREDLPNPFMWQSPCVENDIARVGALV
eukprot:2435298-Pleurochrysis_carterae.AAC.4